VFAGQSHLLLTAGKHFVIESFVLVVDQLSQNYLLGRGIFAMDHVLSSGF
jgi:hypothetical protein